MKTEIEKEMQLFENECKVLCYKGNISRSNLGSFYNNEQTNWMYQMWLSSKNREGYKLVPVEKVMDCLYQISDRSYVDDNVSEIKAMIGATE